MVTLHSKRVREEAARSFGGLDCNSSVILPHLLFVKASCKVSTETKDGKIHSHYLMEVAKLTLHLAVIHLSVSLYNLSNGKPSFNHWRNNKIIALSKLF